ncbi:MAG: hypothetical protein H7246_18550 [Phycisphaerae bacterium]|nr:hypothetical protein [Saprospiraceae bacterium]
MLNNLLKCSLALLFVLATTWVEANAGTTENALPQTCVGGPELTVTAMSAASALASWTEFGASGQYTVTVVNLNTFTVVANFTTSATSAVITGLSTGNTYRYTIAKANDFIIDDVVH